jgi:hypothetical protein
MDTATCSKQRTARDLFPQHKPRTKRGIQSRHAYALSGIEGTQHSTHTHTRTRKDLNLAGMALTGHMRRVHSRPSEQPKVDPLCCSPRWHGPTHAQVRRQAQRVQP